MIGIIEGRDSDRNTLRLYRGDHFDDSRTNQGFMFVIAFSFYLVVLITIDRSCWTISNRNNFIVFNNQHTREDYF
ncbi:hypothetical protein V1477_014384 [Vespula maculifrons]|uniref:Uncharacterized protein n=1 Tax=Vespula maculifrons TaxID=7453 RepID=A0ABD2BKX2_VESMC